MASRPSFGKLVHCETCGEDYSVTYKRCPFCGAKNAPRPVVQSEEEFDDGYVFEGQDLFDDEPEDGAPVSRPKGGKRLAGGPGRAPEPINWPRLITFLCSLVIIVAALIIVFTVIYPQLRGGKDPEVVVSEEPSVQSEEPAPGLSAAPSADPVGDNTDSPVDVPTPEPPASAQPPAPSGLSAIKLNRDDFTLTNEEAFRLQAAFTPSDWSGTVTWSSSDERYATVDASGLVTNVNTTDTLHLVIVTATADGVSAECKVYCRGVSAGEPSAEPEEPSAEPTAEPSAEPSSEPTAEPSSAPSGDGLTAGSRGVITGADGGLRVRSGPGTSYGVVASLVNGSAVTIVADAGDGWYQIRFSGSGGATTEGYIMGEYIAVR